VEGIETIYNDLKKKLNMESLVEFLGEVDRAGAHIENIVLNFNRRPSNVPLSLVLLDAIHTWGYTYMGEQDFTQRGVARQLGDVATKMMKEIRQNHGNMFLRLIKSCVSPQEMMDNIATWTSMMEDNTIDTATALPAPFATFLTDPNLLQLLRELKIDQEGVFVPPDCNVCLELAVSAEDVCVPAHRDKARTAGDAHWIHRKCLQESGGRRCPACREDVRHIDLPPAEAHIISALGGLRV
jgi:hypothetical protein